MKMINTDVSENAFLFSTCSNCEFSLSLIAMIRSIHDHSEFSEIELLTGRLVMCPLGSTSHYCLANLLFLPMVPRT